MLKLWLVFLNVYFHMNYLIWTSQQPISYFYREEAEIICIIRAIITRKVQNQTKLLPPPNPSLSPLISSQKLFRLHHASLSADE